MSEDLTVANHHQLLSFIKSYKAVLDCLHHQGENYTIMVNSVTCVIERMCLVWCKATLIGLHRKGNHLVYSNFAMIEMHLHPSDTGSLTWPTVNKTENMLFPPIYEYFSSTTRSFGLHKDEVNFSHIHSLFL